MLPRERAARQREHVAALLIVQPERRAGASPFHAMRRNAALPGAIIREQMRKLVAQGALDFLRSKLAQTRVQGDRRFRGERGAGGAAHARIPTRCHSLREHRSARREQELAGALRERGIFIGHGTPRHGPLGSCAAEEERAEEIELL